MKGKLRAPVNGNSIAENFRIQTPFRKQILLAGQGWGGRVR
jgi:hypothetical protein